MRWRERFMDEVLEALHQLGLRACPVCDSAESLSMSPFPVLLVDAGFYPEADDPPMGAKRGGDMTFAVRVECPTCGHLMLFDAQKYRCGDEKIMVLEPAEEQERNGEI